MRNRFRSFMLAGASDLFAWSLVALIFGMWLAYQ